MLDFILVFVILLAGQAFCGYIKLAPNHSSILGFILACVMAMARLKSWIA